MSLFEFCLEIIRRESNKFNVGVNTAVASQITAATASDVNFDNAHNRCSFLYRCGAINLSFARDCFKKFLSDEKSKFLFSKCSNLTVCSISKGPALDYIALLLSYQECNILPLINSVKLISKYGAWRNTANIMFEVLKEGFLTCLPPSVSFGDIEVIQGDPFHQFTEKVKNPICNSNIILMVKTLNLKDDGFGQIYAQVLQEFLDTLRPDTIIFCIDTKPSIAVITHQLCSFAGHFLYEPTHINTLINVEHVDFYKDIFGCFPVLSARGSFFVWQKSSLTSPTLGSLLGEVKESFKSQSAVNNIHDNVYSNKLCESVYSKLFGNSCSKQEIASTSLNVCDLNESLKHMKLNGSTQLLDNGNIDQNSKQILSQSSSQNNTPAYNYIRENSDLCEKMLNNSLVNQAVQTEPEDFGIIELSSKISKLTTSFKEIIQLNELDKYKNGNCLEDTKIECKQTVLNDCLKNHTSSPASCMHSCQCSKILQPAENCCQNHVCHQREQFASNHYGSNVSLDESEVLKHDGSHNMLQFSGANNSVSTPTLVIPLNSLSGDAISQIISIITQAQQ